MCVVVGYSYFNNSKNINIISVLMEESKLTMMQRKKINYNLRNGEPLPILGGTSRRSRTKIPEVTIRPGSSRRRSRDEIISSGAYEREPFRARKICNITQWHFNNYNYICSLPIRQSIEKKKKTNWLTKCLITKTLKCPYRNWSKNLKNRNPRSN